MQSFTAPRVIRAPAGIQAGAPMTDTTLPDPPRNRRQARRNAWLPALALSIAALLPHPATAAWKLVDEGACEGPIISFTEGQEPAKENCTPAMAGKGALCYTEVCRPHCLYFNYPLEQCPHGADMGKRFVCVPD